MKPLRIFLLFCVLVLVVGPYTIFLNIHILANEASREMDAYLAEAKYQEQHPGVEYDPAQFHRPAATFCSACSMGWLLSVVLGYVCVGVLVWVLILFFRARKISWNALRIQTLIVGLLVLPIAIWEGMMFYCAFY